jgi:hypothetical protein
MNKEVATGKVFDKLIVRPLPVCTVIRGGCHVPPACRLPFIAVQVTGPLDVPQTHPHIGTELPSGSVIIWLVAVRLTDWANDALAAKRRIVSVSAAFCKASLGKLDRIDILLITVFRR